MEKKVKKYNVLIISHPPFSKNFNMGRTLESYFQGLECSTLAQLYFRPDKPSGELCHNFYQFTDSDAMKSIILRRHKGKIYKNYYEVNESLVMDKGQLRTAYNIGVKKIPFFMTIRNAIWSLSSWYNKSLKNWLDEFNPNIVFFAAGDYSFSYRIAIKIAKKRKIPLIMCCFDDFFIYDINNKGFFGTLNHKILLKDAKKTVDVSKKLIVTNSLMSKEYEKLFGVHCPILFTSSSITRLDNRDTKNKISYLGNLGLGRYEKLVEFGQKLRIMNDSNLPKHIDVYSSVDDISKYPLLNEENGIHFHGSVSYSEVLNIIDESLAVLHVESTNDIYRRRVHFSLSTKIADSLGSNAVLIAYGPIEVASFQYLIENKCAIVIGEDDDFEKKIKCLNDNEIKDDIIKNAHTVFEKNHYGNKNSLIVKKIIENSLIERNIVNESDTD